MGKEIVSGDGNWRAFKFTFKINIYVMFVNVLDSLTKVVSLIFLMFNNTTRLAALLAYKRHQANLSCLLCVNKIVWTCW